MIFVFFNDTAATEIYTLSLHDALPIWGCCAGYVGERRVTPGAVLSAEGSHLVAVRGQCTDLGISKEGGVRERSEEHTSELQSRQYLVCRLLLEKKQDRHGVLAPL